MALKKRQKEILISVTIVILFFVALYHSLKEEKCLNIECFKENMLICKPAHYINEDPQASWEYNIIEEKNNKCNIKVTLINAKEGELGLKNYNGKSMICSYGYGIFAYPEKNLGLCHGELKEGMQTILIDKLYNQIIKNLGEIREEFKKTI